MKTRKVILLTNTLCNYVQVIAVIIKAIKLLHLKSLKYASKYALENLRIRSHKYLKS